LFSRARGEGGASGYKTVKLVRTVIKSKVHKVYKELLSRGQEVLFDDREDVTAGEKFADADLIGIPYRLVVSKRTGDKIEVKKRDENYTKLVSLDKLVSKLS